jgi:hypothetical protein
MSIREVSFHWNDEHGDCYDCGAPALFVVAELYWNRTTEPDSPPAVTKHNLFCPVCASHHAANGHRIYRLFTDDTDPVANEEHERLLTELGIDFSKPTEEAPR